jgi:hypothetical protein
MNKRSHVVIIGAGLGVVGGVSAGGEGGGGDAGRPEQQPHEGFIILHLTCAPTSIGSSSGYCRPFLLCQLLSPG